MSSPNPVISARARVALLSRPDRGTPAKVAEARRVLTAAKLERHIREVIAGAPPLTAEVRDRLAALLATGVA